ncbi:MAG: hypothetical protein IT378_04545, partial [Sandaracinaceae bacterium]|nr:hypothetical protein [Sandaracinaceae bacterium]
MMVPSQGTNSLMQPGVLLRFRTGPPPTTQSGDSEDDGFVTSTVTITPGSTMGNAVANMIYPYERAIVALNANDSIVDLVLPTRQSNEGVSIAAWLEQPSSSSASSVGVWMRCNAYPDAANWDYRQYFQPNVPVFIRPIAIPCSGNWYVTIGSSAPGVAKLVHLTASAHNLNRIVTGTRIGVKWNANATERAGILYGLRSAAWRAYGMSMGTILMREFWLYNNSSCSKIDGCGGAGCSICITLEDCTSNVGSLDGYMTICDDEAVDLQTNNWGWIDTVGQAAQVIAHELGHQWMAQPDEYSKVGAPCNHGYNLCGHTMMESYHLNTHGLCNNADHRGHVEDDRVSPRNRILGPNGYSCQGGALWLDAQSGWSRLSQA